jgi:hypothetical protein
MELFMAFTPNSASIRTEREIFVRIPFMIYYAMIYNLEDSTSIINHRQALHSPLSNKILFLIPKNAFSTAAHSSTQAPKKIHNQQDGSGSR